VVAVHAGAGLARPLWQRAGTASRRRAAAYALAGATAVVLAAQWLVLVLVLCGTAELIARRAAPRALSLHPWALAAAAPAGGLGALAWTALKVGALSFGGGFVIVPLMQADAVQAHHWMSDSRFLDAVALGQVTPGPVVATVAAVGYAAHGVGGGLLAALVAFAPSFAFVLAGAARFERLLGDPRAQGFFAGAAPATVGAIVGAAIPLAGALAEAWQVAVLAAAVVALFVLRRGVVPTLLAAGAVGAVAALAGAPLPG
jgi:chromate transporter